MKMQYTEEQIARANQTDLVSFLNAQGEQLVKSGREYRWKKHDSVTISGNRWYRHSQSKGGYPVDFERIISCLYLKQPLICFRLFSYFQKIGKNAAI